MLIDADAELAALRAMAENDKVWEGEFRKAFAEYCERAYTAG